MTTVQHGSLTRERWAGFPLEQQVLMIANEMNRAAQLFGPADQGRLRSALERVLALTDLTIGAQPARGFRKELLRWRDLIAALYVSSPPPFAAHRAAFRALLLLTPAGARQIPHVLGGVGTGSAER